MVQFNHRCNSVMEEISEDAVSLMREYLELIYLIQKWFI
jgi:hypothetical protein